MLTPKWTNEEQARYKPKPMTGQKFSFANQICENLAHFVKATD